MECIQISALKTVIYCVVISSNATVQCTGIKIPSEYVENVCSFSALDGAFMLSVLNLYILIFIIGLFLTHKSMCIILLYIYF